MEEEIRLTLQGLTGSRKLKFSIPFKNEVVVPTTAKQYQEFFFKGPIIHRLLFAIWLLYVFYAAYT